MFSGIIESMGTIGSLASNENGCTLEVATKLAQKLGLGESIAVNGVCLTTTRVGPDYFTADISTETLKRTTFSSLAAGAHVNLERPLQVGAHLGGHFVQGHVDGVGSIVDIRPEADTRFFDIAFPKSLAIYFVEKGSVSIDGISLTIANLKFHSFEVAIIPFTMENTNLQYIKQGALVNIECDMLGKYVCKYLEQSQAGAARPAP